MPGLLDLKDDERILEIGTGSGYQAAILAELVKEVYTLSSNPIRICPKKIISFVEKLASFLLSGNENS
jgi:cyclopropane fatty-acyl-phospholipid synthase-like methyltransferase